MENLSSVESNDKLINSTYINTSINYSETRAEPGKALSMDPSANKMSTHEVLMHDAREFQNELSLDKEGFILVEMDSLIKDFSNPQEFEDAYGKEIQELLKRVIGASEVITWAAGARYSPVLEESKNAGFVSQVAKAAHGDFSEYDFGKKEITHPIVSAVIEKAGIDLKKMKRWKCFNIWQAISPPPQDIPLVLCDASSVSVEDISLSQADIPLPDGSSFVLSVYIAHHNKNHRWSYFPNLKKNEVIIFSGFDPTAGATHRVVPHSAFTDPSYENAIPRKSIEIRAMAFFED